MEDVQMTDIFDRAPSGIPLFVGGSRPNTERGLWLTVPLGLSGMDELMELVVRQGGVDEVIIRDLDHHPGHLDQWARWIARWSDRQDLAVIVDTEGLTCERRRRLINGTRRFVWMERRRDPARWIWRRGMDWLTRRWR